MEKVYKVKVVATIQMVCNEIDWREDGGIGEFNEFTAIQYAKGCLIEKLVNDPNRGCSVAIRIK